jgi:hypothetical protein
MTLFALLTLIKTTLANMSNVASCQIDLEANITPADYPLVRIILMRLASPNEGSMRRQVEMLIYFGAALLEASDGLETVYETLLTTEGEILEQMQFVLIGAALQQGHFLQSRFIETLTDEDRLPHHKLFASRFQVKG